MAKYKVTESGVQDTETGKFIPNAPGNRDWKEYQQWLAEGNEPKPEFTEEEQKQQRIAEIKQKASADILNIAPEWKQRNMLATMLELQEKRLSGETLTIEEEETIRQLSFVWTQIKQIREQSNIDENEVN